MSERNILLLARHLVSYVFMARNLLRLEPALLGQLDLPLILVVHCESPEFQLPRTAVQWLAASVSAARLCLDTRHQQVRS